MEVDSVVIHEVAALRKKEEPSAPEEKWEQEKYRMSRRNASRLRPGKEQHQEKAEVEDEQRIQIEAQKKQNNRRTQKEESGSGRSVGLFGSHRQEDREPEENVVK